MLFNIPEQEIDLSKYVNEGQNPAILRLALPALFDLCMHNRGEWPPIAMFHQQVPLLPAVVAITTERLILYRRTLFGGGDVREYWKPFLGPSSLVEGPLLAKVEWKGRPFTELVHVDNPPGENTEAWLAKPMSVNMMPKPQAKRLFGMLRENDAYWLEEWRIRSYEFYRANKGTLYMKEGTPDFMAGFSLDPQAALSSFEPIDSSKLRPIGQSTDSLSAPSFTTSASSAPSQPVEPPKPTTEELVEHQLKELKMLFTTFQITEEDYKKRRDELMEKFVKS